MTTNSSVSIAGVLPVLKIEEIHKLEDAKTLESLRSSLREKFICGMGFYEFLVYMSGEGTGLQDVQRTPPVQLAHMLWSKFRHAKEMKKIYDSIKK